MSLIDRIDPANIDADISFHMFSALVEVLVSGIHTPAQVQASFTPKLTDLDMADLNKSVLFYSGRGTNDRIKTHSSVETSGAMWTHGVIDRATFMTAVGLAP